MNSVKQLIYSTSIDRILVLGTQVLSVSTKTRGVLHIGAFWSRVVGGISDSFPYKCYVETKIYSVYVPRERWAVWVFYLSSRVIPVMLPFCRYVIYSLSGIWWAISLFRSFLLVDYSSLFLADKESLVCILRCLKFTPETMNLQNFDKILSKPS